MRIFVVIPTLGRPGVVAESVRFLTHQTRKPDGVIVVAVKPSDVSELVESSKQLAQSGVVVDVQFTTKGSCRQRNHALELLRDKADAVVMLDDDFLPAPDFLANAEAHLRENPDVVGMNGEMLADGARGPGLSFEEAREIIAKRPTEPASGAGEWPLEALYGCNMVVRASAIEGLSFDENLPLYGWQEDIDFTFRLGQRGRLIKSGKLQGVHLGVKSGKTPGKQLGYSQIANPIYLLHKRTIPPRLAMKLLIKNPLANVFRLFAPEPYVDRLGRLQGNLLALFDMACGRLHPRRVEQLV